ncbi:MAG: uracil-DNA glycosylase family protein [Hellea sp.]|nr:uracil-DNA glycosylase family protein [Hellea sp.]
MSDLDKLLSEIRVCKVCEFADKPMPHSPRPVVVGTKKSRIRIIGQAPGTRVHASGIPFDDPSGDRLRNWLGVSKKQFYNPDLFSITPMGFCFPGLDTKGGDLPPRNECAPLWQDKLTDGLKNVELTLLVGQYAQKKYLGKRRQRNLTETVRHWRDYGPDVIPLPHPSWRNNAWIKKNMWFNEVLEALKTRIVELTER